MPTPVRLLIVEDSQNDAELMAVELQRAGFDPTWRRVETITDMRLALADGPWDVVLSDNSSPGLDAPTALAISRESAPDVPFVVVSGTIDAATAVEVVRTGANDFVLKSQLHRLPPILVRELRDAAVRRLRRVADEDARRLAAVVWGANDAVIAKKLDGTITHWNPAAERLLGWTATEAVGRHISLIVPPDRTAELETIMARIRAGERIDHSDTVRVRKDGTRFDASLTISPVRDADGQLIGASKILRDVSCRVRAEEGLRLRDRAIQALNQGVLITDARRPDNPIVYVGPGFERMTGYAASEIFGWNCRFLQGPDTDPAAVTRIRDAIRDGRPVTVELLNYRKDRTPFWNELSITPVRDAAGRVTHFVGVQSDITERRRLEEHFHQAQKMEAVGELAGGVAHDFNNLLTVITGYCEILLDDTPPGTPARAMLEEVRKAGEQSASLTQQLLAFSHKQVVVPRSLDLNNVVVDAGKMIRRVIGEDVRLITDLEPTLGTVRADPGQIEQVLINLAVNAREAMPRGGTLTVRTANVGPDGVPSGVVEACGQRPGFVLLSVTDTGSGIAPEVRGRMYEPLFTTKDKSDGAGLGLAVVHGIVRQSEGHIEVDTEVGTGTAFRIYLPSEETKSPDQTGSGIRTAPRGDETVLVVEDEDGVRALARQILSGCGYDVLVAATAAEAVRVAAGHPEPIHLLVTDIVMPGASGRDLAERLTAMRPGLAVLYVSGYTDDAVLRHGVRYDRDNFLQKPFAAFTLARAARAVLDEKSIP